MPGTLLSPYVGLSPVVFKMENRNGINIKPEIGFRFNSGGFTRNQPASVSLNVSYGYDIPIVNESAFKIGRQDLTAKIAITLNFNDISCYYKEWKQKKKETSQPVEENE